MAIKAIMLRKKIENFKTQLETLRNESPDFKKREAELEAAIEEAATPEEEAAVEEAVEAFETEKKAFEEKETELETAIADAEAELAEMERTAKVPAPTDKKGEKRTMKLDINIRSLPKNTRVFDAIPEAQRTEIVERDDVKAFLAELRSYGLQKRDITGAELTIPVVLLDLISENMFRYSKLMNRVRVRNVGGEARQTIAGTVPEAFWTEMCAAINELNFVFNQVTLDGYKVAGYIPVCNSVLNDSDVNLAGWIVEMLSESIGLAKDKAILYGKGAASRMPLGIVTRLAQTVRPEGYPQNAPEWVNLSTTNIKQISASATGAEFWSQLTLAAGNTYSPYARGELFWAMNSKTLAMLKSKAITFTATGDVVANVYDALPIITGNIDVLEFIPDGDIIGGYGDLYLWAQRASLVIDESIHAQFIQDNTLFRGRERADGMPVVPSAFVAMNINGTAPTTTMTFAGESSGSESSGSESSGSESSGSESSGDESSGEE